MLRFWHGLRLYLNRNNNNNINNNKMKKLIFTLITTMMIGLSTVSAQNTTVLTNKIPTEQRTSKEYIYFDVDTKTPIKKFKYVFDENKLPVCKIVYKWNQSKGWREIMQFTYNYNGSTLAFITYDKWNMEKKVWTKTTQVEYLNNELYIAER